MKNEVYKKKNVMWCLHRPMLQGSTESTSTWYQKFHLPQEYKHELIFDTILYNSSALGCTAWMLCVTNTGSQRPAAAQPYMLLSYPKSKLQFAWSQRQDIKRWTEMYNKLLKMSCSAHLYAGTSTFHRLLFPAWDCFSHISHMCFDLSPSQCITHPP